MIRIAILGYGTIGKGVYALALKHAQIEVKYVFDKVDFKDVLNHVYTNDINQVLTSNEVDVIVETLGGFDFAYGIIKKALSKKKHVVSANKEVISAKLFELEKLSDIYGVELKYSASVGGGIPIVNNLNEILKVSDIESFEGILNGTTNFILTKIFEENLSFDEALEQAQFLGFAEKDPTADLKGLDTARKILIVAQIASNAFIDMNHMLIKGIENIPDEVIKTLRLRKETIKLIGRFEMEEGKISLSVLPTIMSLGNPFYHIRYEQNMVSIKPKYDNYLTLTGKGAGRFPTAGDIILDILNIENKQHQSDVEKK